MTNIKIPEFKGITSIPNPINLSDLNSSTFSHFECSARGLNRWTEEETKTTYYNTNPKSAIRLITRWKVDMFGNRTKLLSEIRTLHIFNDDGSEDMFQL